MGNLFSSPQTTYQVPQLPSYLQNYLQTAGGYLGNQITQPTTYPGPFTADISPWTSQGITNLTTQAQAAAPLAPIGFNTLGATAGGQYLNNPYVQSIASSLAAQGQQQMQQSNQQAQQQFAQMGLGNSTPLLNTQAQIAGQVIPGTVGAIGGVLNQAYQAERQNQMQAAGLSAQLPASLAQAQIQAGLIPQQTLQNMYNAQYQSFLNQQQQQAQAAAPFTTLAAYLQRPQQVSYGQPPITGLMSGASSLIGAIPGLGGMIGGALGGLFNKGGRTQTTSSGGTNYPLSGYGE